MDRMLGLTVCLVNSCSLGRDDFFVNDEIVMIGVCGWWNGDPFQEKITERARQECDIICKKLFHYSTDSKIKEIIVVTHTVPKKRFAKEPDTDHNSLFETLPLKKMSAGKLTTWIFGHNHQKFKVIIDGIKFISNPRGRPDDFNRKKYLPIRIYPTTCKI